MLIDFKEHTKKQTTLNSEISALFTDLKKQKKKRFDYWYQAVGEKIGKIAIPTYKKNDVLYVSVVNPVSRFELTRMKPEILESVNKLLSENKKLKDILFK